jgi:hypothetical protein
MRKENPNLIEEPTDQESIGKAEQDLVKIAMKRVREGYLEPGPMAYGQPVYSISVFQKVLLKPAKFDEVRIEITDEKVKPGGWRDMLGLKKNIVSIGPLDSGLTIRLLELKNDCWEEVSRLRLPRSPKLVGDGNLKKANNGNEFNAARLKTLARIVKRARKVTS